MGTNDRQNIIARLPSDLKADVMNMLITAYDDGYRAGVLAARERLPLPKQ